MDDRYFNEIIKLNAIVAKSAESISGVNTFIAKIESDMKDVKECVTGLRKDADKRQKHWELTAVNIEHALKDNTTRIDILEKDVKEFKTVYYKKRKYRWKESAVVSIIVYVIIELIINTRIHEKNIVEVVKVLLTIL